MLKYKLRTASWLVWNNSALKDHQKMPNVCCVRGCKNNSGKTNHSFHCFPKDLELKTKWLSNLNLDPNFAVSRSIKVCSAHFAHDAFTYHLDYSKNQKRRLREGAVPQTKDEQVIASSLPSGKNYFDKRYFADAAVQTKPSLTSKSVQCDGLPVIKRHVFTQTIAYETADAITTYSAAQWCEPILMSTPIKQEPV